MSVKSMIKSIQYAVCLVACLILLAVPTLMGMAQEGEVTVITYPGPSGIEASRQYAVTVNGTSSFMYQTDRSSRFPDEAQTVSFTGFAFSGGSVTIEVTKLGTAAVDSVTIRPLDNDVQAEISGNTAVFTIDRPMHLSVEFNGDTTDKCFIFADAPETDVPDKDAENVWYFAPGVYDIGESDFPEGKNIMYIAGGAYVKGKITANCQNRGEVKILGRGIFSGENNAHSDLNHLIGIYQADRFIMDGPILLDSNSFHIQVTGSKSTPEAPNILNNVKEIAWVTNSDGFHMNGHIQVSNLFIYNYDDAIDISQYTQSAVVRDCVVWNNMYGSALLLGWVSKVDTGNAVVDNIDVIHFDEYRMDAANNAVIMANHGEMGHIDNVYIHDVRVESFGGGVQKFISLRLNKSAWSGATSPYGNISNIYLSDIRIDPPSMDNVLQGKDTEHAIRNVVFENLTIAGSPVTNMEEAGLTANEFVGGVRFIQTTMNNGSFEAGSVKWETQGTEGAAKVSRSDLTERTAGNGLYFGEHSAEQAYTADSYQSLSNLKPGRYCLTAKVKAEGTSGNSYMYARVGDICLKYPIEITGDWQQIRIPNITVNDGTCIVGFHTEGGGEDVLCFDQVSFAKQEKQLVNEANVVLEALSVTYPEPATTTPTIPETQETESAVPGSAQEEATNHRPVLILLLIVNIVLLIGAGIVFVIIRNKRRDV